MVSSSIDACGNGMHYFPQESKKCRFHHLAEDEDRKMQVIRIQGQDLNAFD